MNFHAVQLLILWMYYDTGSIAGRPLCLASKFDAVLQKKMQKSSTNSVTTLHSGQGLFFRAYFLLWARAPARMSRNA